MQRFNQRKKIVFVGGHHTTALAVIGALERQAGFAGSYEIHWIGHKFSMWKDRNPGAEYREVTEKGIPFYDLKAGKVYRTFNPLKLIRFPFGFLQALYFLFKIKPYLIVSFGGYLAVPVVVVGWFLGIPSVTHEQTVVRGWANTVLAKFAKKVFLTWPESLNLFSTKKASLVGLPLRHELLSPLALDELSRFGGEETEEFLAKVSQLKLPLIYFTGGKQGSHLLNIALEGALPKLLQKCFVVHQCGSSSIYEDYKRFKALRFSLGEMEKGRYFVKEYFRSEELGAILKIANLVVGRSGANTVYELCALGKPAIFIPIPWVSHNEQQKNAEIMGKRGAAFILEQDNLSVGSLASYIDKAISDLPTISGNAKKLQELIRFDAAQVMAEEILALV